MFGNILSFANFRIIWNKKHYFYDFLTLQLWKNTKTVFLLSRLEPGNNTTVLVEYGMDTSIDTQELIKDIQYYMEKKNNLCVTQEHPVMH